MFRRFAACMGLLLTAGLGFAQAPCARGGPVLSTRGSSCYHCQRIHCPPPLRWCQERPIHIHFQHGCPRPVCDPCHMPNWGYWQTCWSPWPWPPDWSHCPVPPPAAQVVPGLMPPHQNEGLETGPTPSKIRPPL